MLMYSHFYAPFDAEMDIVLFRFKINITFLHFTPLPP